MNRHTHIYTDKYVITAQSSVLTASQQAVIEVRETMDAHCQSWNIQTALFRRRCFHYFVDESNEGGKIGDILFRSDLSTLKHYSITFVYDFMFENLQKWGKQY